MRKKIAVAFGTILIAAPALLFAQTTSTTTTQLAAELQKQIEALFAQMQAIRPTTSASAPIISTTTITPTTPGSCVIISRTLTIGSRGDDVAALQRYFAKDPSIYADGSATGYFGPLTEAAVKKYQAKYSIVSSGSPSTNGFGAVGPRTRLLLQVQSCGTGAAVSTPSSPNAPRCTVVASTNATRPGDPVTITWSSSNSSYGSNTLGERVELNGSATFKPTESTTYTYSFFGFTAGTPAVCSIRVFVETQNLPTQTPVQTPTADSLFATPQEGASPLYVNFTFRPGTGIACTARNLTIDFGDGISEILTSNVCGSSNIRATLHAYRVNGIYTARVLDNTACGSNTRCNASRELASAAVRVAGPSACTLNGATVAHGESRDFYNVTVVLPGASCGEKKVTRTCTDGVLSGETSYQYLSCTVAPAQACSLDGVSVPSGTSRSFYTTSSVAAGQSCQSISRSCTEGTLSGSGIYNKASCTVASLASCSIDGITLAHGTSSTFYFAQNVPAGELCSSYAQTRSCSNGTLGGSIAYKYATCAPVSSNSCALDNTVVTNGASASFYRHAVAPAGELCSAHVLSRTCSNGTLSGNSSYIYSSCTNQTTCSLDGVTLGHSSSTVFYKERTVAFGTTCTSVSQTRTCTNGALSGTAAYEFASCTVNAPTASLQQNLASALAALESAVRTILGLLD